MTVEELLTRLEPVVLYHARNASIPGMDAEDIAQELRIEVWRKHDKFLNGKSKPETFANLVFRRRIINLHRNMTNPNMNRNWLTLDTEMVVDDHGIELQYPAETDLMKCWDWDSAQRLVEFFDNQESGSVNMSDGKEDL